MPPVSLNVVDAALRQCSEGCSWLRSNIATGKRETLLLFILKMHFSNVNTRLSVMRMLRLFSEMHLPIVLKIRAFFVGEDHFSAAILRFRFHTCIYRERKMIKIRSLQSVFENEYEYT